MRYFLLPGMALVLTLGMVAMATADPPAPCDYLLLKNGAVLTGRVTLEGQTYVVRSPTSAGESRYPASMVAKRCKSAAEVYAILKKYSVEDDAGDHCRLAKFCLTHNLMKEARLEIEEAFKYERRSPEAQVLLKQWTAQQQSPAKQSDVIPDLPSSALPLLPAALLEEWPVAMAPAGFHDYTQRVQPILMVGCGTGACHGVPEGKRGFILRRTLPGVPPSPFISKTNLERVLGLVDRDNPEASELLKRARQPHGNTRNWPVNQNQLDALRQWVLYVSGKQELVRQTEQPGSEKKPSNQFASGTDKSTDTPVESTGKLPTIPGMTGSAIQQTGATVESQPPQQTEQKLPPGGSGILPPIPGLSGKGQNGKAPPPQNEASNSKSANDNTAQQAAMIEFARKMGVAPPLPAHTGPIPERLKIINAGNYRIDLPPLPEFSEEIKEMLRRQEAIKNGEAKETPGNASLFLRSGTVVSSPPR